MARKPISKVPRTPVDASGTSLLRRAFFATAATAIVAALTACGAAGADSTAREAGSSPIATVTHQAAATAPSLVAKVFFVKGEQFAPRARAVPQGKAAATVALESLLAGPTVTERAAGIETTLPKGTKLTSLTINGGTATVELSRVRSASTAFDVSLRPARAAQLVYTLTAIPGVTKVQLRVNGLERATFMGTKLALKGPLDKLDLSKPIMLPAKPSRVPKGHAPADPRGVQKRLASLRYLPTDAVTGAWDARTAQAMLAFQAWHGLERDGIVGARTLAALENAARPKPSRAVPGRHVEVYRDRGVTLLAEGATVVRAIHSSSGTRGYETPAGTYSIFRKERNSWSFPYQVWLPYASYFNGGIAFHAYPQVPAHPASHGCVRLSASEAPFAYTFMTMGTRVSVY